MSDKREGPRIELNVFCGGCAHLDTEKSYGSNDYEEIDYVCAAAGNKRVPSYTPDWCPFYPRAEIDAATVALAGLPVTVERTK